jgi:putative hydrolase of the HAD superfamily
VGGQRVQAEALLLDLDGVLRVFDPEVAASVERRHGLPDGSLVRSALSLHRLRPAIAGEKCPAAWLESIVADLADVEEWQEYRG